MDNVTCISHSEDIDGLVCAAFLKMAKNAKCILVNYSDLLEKLKSIDDRTDALYICDLQLDTSVINELKRIIKTTRVFYIDHHPSKDKTIELLKDLKVNLHHSTDKCAGILTYQLMKRELPKEASILAAYASLSDYPYKNEEVSNFLEQFDPHLLAFEYSILYYALAKAYDDDNFKYTVVDELSSLKFPHEIDNVINLAENQIKYSINLLKSAGSNISSGKNLVCIEVSGNTSVIANMLMNMVKKHVLICYSKFKDAHANIYCNLSIRNKKDRNNLGTITARIAKEVKGNGGGHPKAAAAQLPQRNFLKFVKFLDNEI